MSRCLESLTSSSSPHVNASEIIGDGIALGKAFLPFQTTVCSLDSGSMC